MNVGAFNESKWRNFIKEYRAELLELGAEDDDLDASTFATAQTHLLPWIGVLQSSVTEHDEETILLMLQTYNSADAAAVWNGLSDERKLRAWRFAEFFFDAMTTTQ